MSFRCKFSKIVHLYWFESTTMTIFRYLFLVLPFVSWSQNGVLESNKKQVDSLFFANQVEALELSETSIPIALKSNDTFYITYFLDQAGELNRMLGNYEEAIGQISQCLNYKVNWEDKRDLSLSYNNLGKTYANRGQYELAAKHFLQALEIMEKASDLQGQAYYLNNLGALYDLQHNYAKAISHYKRSLIIKKELGDIKGIAATHTNLGISYYNLGDYPKAIDAYKQAIRIQRDQKDPTKLARGLSNLGKVYVDLGNLSAAREALMEAYGMKEEIGDAQLVGNMLNNVSSYYIAVGNMDSALFYNNAAIDLAQSNRAWKTLRDGYRDRAEIYAKGGDFPKAYDALEQSIAYDDSLVNEANIYAVADMEGKYNYEKNLRKIKEQELKQLRTDRELDKKRSQLVYLLAGSLLLVLVVVVLVLGFRQKRRQNNLLKGQNRLIDRQKNEAEQLNASLSEQLDTLQLTIEEKEQLLNKVFQSRKEVELPPELLSLSKREMEVLSYLALGRTDDQIAQSLFVSKSTVKTHLRRIYSKLLVSGRAEAVAIAHKYSLFDITDS